MVNSRPEFEASFSHTRTLDFGKELSFSIYEQGLYGNFLEKYMKSKNYKTSQKLKRESPKDVLDDMLDSMDERLDDITQAFRMIEANGLP